MGSMFYYKQGIGSCTFLLPMLLQSLREIETSSGDKPWQSSLTWRVSGT